MPSGRGCHGWWKMRRFSPGGPGGGAGEKAAAAGEENFAPWRRGGRQVEPPGGPGRPGSGAMEVGGRLSPSETLSSRTGPVRHLHGLKGC